MRHWCLLFTFLLLSAFGAEAQQPLRPGKAALSAEAENWKKDPTLRHAAWSLAVHNISKNTPEYTWNADMTMVPASVMKVFTTATALALLGEDYRFETQLLYSGHLDSLQGILHGNLYLKGSGDPSLGSQRFGEKTRLQRIFAEFASMIYSMGIRKIEGKLLADESVFDELIPGSWSYEDAGNYYAAPVSGIAVNENKFRLFFNAGAGIGEPAVLTGTDPIQSDVTFINNVTTGASGSGDQVFVNGTPYVHVRVLTGTVPLGARGFDVDAALVDPPLTAVRTLAGYLLEKGIEITGSVSTLRAERWKGTPDTTSEAKKLLLTRYFSPTLREIIYFTNQKSNNMFAEHLLKRIGVQRGKAGSTRTGCDTIIRYWTTHGVDLDGFEMYDGSGLSRRNRVSASQLCHVLQVINETSCYSAFAASLPVAGRSGGLASLLKNTSAENNLRAKTGTMDGVRSYAGYVKNSRGEQLAFVLLVNNFSISGLEMRRKCERMLLRIAELD